MKINFELGEIYDTIMYYEIYYNYDEFIQDFKDRNYDIKEGLKYYKRVKKDLEILSQLHAFFDLNKNEKSLLTSLFISKIEKIKTINDYLLLLKNKDLILNYLIDYYFEGIILQEKEEIKSNHTDNTTIQRIFDLEISGNVKASLVLIFTSYDEVIDLLISSIYKIFGSIKYLHEINRKFISKFTLKENYLNILKDIDKTRTFDNAIYCISLLQSYSYKIINNTYLILGNLYEEVLDRQYTFINVTFDSICNTFANKLNTLVINIIYQCKKASTSDIINLLPDYSDATIYRVVSNLQIEKVIKMTDNINGKFYYSLNTDYFENASIILKNNLMYYTDKK